MSKIVVLNIPASGHVNPTLPVVQELVQRGEQVIYYNSDEFRAQIEQTGVIFRPYPVTEYTSTEIAKSLQGGDLFSHAVLLLRATENLLPFTLDELAREQPDLVIFDENVLWGRIAATQLSLRTAASIPTFVLDNLLAPLTFRESIRLLRQILSKLPGLLVARRRIARRSGKAFPSFRPLFPMRGDLNIVFTSRELQPDTPIIDETFRFVGPSINLQTRSEDFPFDALDQNPIVYISMGTIHTGSVEFYRQCFETFGSYPAQFVLSAGKQTDMVALEPIPSNFIVRPSVPQLEVLQRVAVFITHGGMNSVHEGLYYGVPLVLIPHQIEQLFNALAVTIRGAGLVLRAQLSGGQITAAQLRQALDTVLSEPSYREAAQALQRSLHATGGYRQAADEIQACLAQSNATLS
jgi:MGT family glycosyltransferase